MEQEKSKIDRIEEKLDMLVETKEPKKKLFKLPFKAKVGKKKVEQGYTTVLKINDNRVITFEKQKIDDQTIMVDGVPRIATADEILSYKGKPFIIQPSWSTKPFSPTDNYAGAVRDSYTTQGWRLLLSRLKSDAIIAKKKVNGMLIFGIIIVVVVLGYLVTKGGMFK